jgi:hypothetical protein
MSVPETVGGGSTELAVPTAAPVGLEDFDVAEEGVIPRLSISHTDCEFTDNLSGESFDTLDVVILGLVKQRILWDLEVPEDPTGPLCKSLNFTEGLPDMEHFPLEASGFTTLESPLPCSSCKLKEWGSHPTRDTPWCGEQHLLIVLMGDAEVPALLTVQRSALKNSRTYLSSFARSRSPLFTVRTTIELDARRRGSVNYAVPKFKKGDPTDEAKWAEYADTYAQVRSFVSTRPAVDEGEVVVEVTASVTPDPAPAAAPAGEDELPF